MCSLWMHMTSVVQWRWTLSTLGSMFYYRLWRSVYFVIIVQMSKKISYIFFYMACTVTILYRCWSPHLEQNWAKSFEYSAPCSWNNVQKELTLSELMSCCSPDLLLPFSLILCSLTCNMLTAACVCLFCVYSCNNMYTALSLRSLSN